MSEQVCPECRQPLRALFGCVHCGGGANLLRVSGWCLRRKR